MVMGTTRIRWLKISLLLFNLLLYGCNNSRQLNNITYNTPTITSAPSANLPRVVVTTSVLCNLTQQIAVETIALSCLIPNTANPRTYQITDQDRETINQAQLILFHGYNLEPNIIKFIQTSKNSIPKIAVAEQAQPKPLLLKSGNKMVADPFIWHDARNATKLADIIRNNLQKLTPKNADIYTQNNQKLVTQINQLHNWIKSRIASIPPYNRAFISTYSELGYYTNIYGLKSLSNLQAIRKNTKLPPERITAIVKDIQKTRVPTIFVESAINPPIFTNISKQAQVRMFERKLFTYGLGEVGSETDSYQQMMTANTRAIVEGLGGTYLMFEPK